MFAAAIRMELKKVSKTEREKIFKRRLRAAVRTHHENQAWQAKTDDEQAVELWQRTEEGQLYTKRKKKRLAMLKYRHKRQ